MVEEMKQVTIVLVSKAIDIKTTVSEQFFLQSGKFYDVFN